MKSPDPNQHAGSRSASPFIESPSIPWIAAAAVVVSVLVVFAALGWAAREASAARHTQQDVQKTWQGLDQLQQVLSVVTDAETAERGFVITGNEVFLQPYEAATIRLQAQLDRLRDLTRSESADEIAVLAQERIELLGRVIDVRRSMGEEAAAAFVRTQEGKQRMDLLRDRIQSLRAHEMAQLNQRVEAHRAQSARTSRLVNATLGGAAVSVLIFAALLLLHIRKRQSAERAANSVAMQLRATMDNLMDGVALLDSQMRLLAWNPQFLELRGLPAADAVVGVDLATIRQRATPLTIVHPDGVEETDSKPPTPEMLERGADAEVHRPDGTVLRIRGRPVPGGYYVLTYTDITQVKVSEAAYRDQATRLASILDNVVDAIVTINESGSIESWSKGAERLFGYRAEEVLRRNVKMLMPEPHALAHDSYLRRYMQTGERRIIGLRREVEALHKDGHQLPVDLGISEMHIGKRRLFIGVIRDISARLEVERLKAGFVSTVSHELRTPLTSISGSLGLLSGGVGGELPPKASRLIEIAKQNSERLVRLINDILDLEKAEAGKLDFRFEPLSLRDIVQQAIEMNRDYASSFGVTITLDPDSVDALVFVDRDRLIQVLTNLLSNAAKFSPSGGLVTVALNTMHDDIAVSVTDQGAGISPEFRSRIFQKFAQADSSDSRAKGGTGLGLSIVKTIMERLGGSVSFVSEVGQGATFQISLPQHKPLHTAPDDQQDRAGGPFVLVCEDDPDVAEVLRVTLHQAGMRVAVAHNAQGARAQLERARFDVAIIDIHLPDIDGLELIAELRSRDATRSLPIIVATARTRDTRAADLISTLQLGDWLQKPIDPRRLLEAIRTSLAHSPENRARILHVEDDASLTQLVHELLDDEAEVIAAHSLADARRCLATHSFDLVILDIALGDGSGLDILPELSRNGLAPPVILYSASEPTREITQRVQAALVKSRDTIDQLLACVRTLARRDSEATARDVNSSRSGA